MRASFRAKGQAEKGRAGRPWVMRHERQGSELKCTPGSVERKSRGVSHASRESRQSSHGSPFGAVLGAGGMAADAKEVRAVMRWDNDRDERACGARVRRVGVPGRLDRRERRKRFLHSNPL